MRRIALAVPLCLIALPALTQSAADPVVTAGNALTAAPTEWLGDKPHFVLMGTVSGQVLDIQMPDIAAAEGVASFAGKREYRAREGGFDYIDFEVGLEAEIGGVERKIELEFENADLSSQTLPATLTLDTAEFPEGAKSNAEIELEWEVGGQTVNAEVAGWSGQMVLAKDEGTPDDKGLSGNGLIGGFVMADLNGETWVLSFTVPVAEYEIDD
jgi:hypothetical protein